MMQPHQPAGLEKGTGQRVAAPDEQQQRQHPAKNGSIEQIGEQKLEPHPDGDRRYQLGIPAPNPTHGKHAKSHSQHQRPSRKMYADSGEGQSSDKGKEEEAGNHEHHQSIGNAHS